MKNVPFTKWTAYGNNFVLVDEIQKPIFAESQKSSFAYQATNVNYGIGSDNFLVVQPYRPDLLREINDVHHYWNGCPDSFHADYIFRMFEPTGEEAFSCGNGLMCVANYLCQEYGIESARIITEIPTSHPKVVTIGTNPPKKGSWVNMLSPERIPREMVDSALTIPYDEHVDMLKEIPINFRSHDLDSFSDATSMTLSGHLVFTGEPHLVVFIETGCSLENVVHTMFLSSDQNTSAVESHEKRKNFGSWLVHHIGTYLNRHYRDHFPSGINVNFVRVIESSGVLEYRCFERGLDRETLACGTGAVAVAFVAKRLNMFSTSEFIVWPYRSRWYDPGAQLYVKEAEKQWLLHGNPVLLFKGIFTISDA